MNFSPTATKNSEIKRVEKGWGYELWIANSPLYCGKLLHFNEKKQCSYHYHKLQDETFYLQSGRIVLFLGETDDPPFLTPVTLYPGDSYHVPAGLRHRMYAIVESDLYEFSTEHFEEDSYRVIKGD